MSSISHLAVTEVGGGGGAVQCTGLLPVNPDAVENSYQVIENFLSE